MKITIITLFPNEIKEILSTSIIGRAERTGLVEYNIVDLRQFGEGLHQVVDGRPFGGGPGMLLRADILAKAWQKATSYQLPAIGQKTILTSASGTQFKQSKAQEFSKLEHLIIVCGHYEGVDQRFIDKYVSEEISIGDFVLTGGELPAMIITDAVVRLIPGVLRKSEAVAEESFSIFQHPSSNIRLLEYPQYTKPQVFEGEKVPKILLSGNHAGIKKWRSKKSLEKTKKIRPDLLKRINFT